MRFADPPYLNNSHGQDRCHSGFVTPAGAAGRDVDSASIEPEITRWLRAQNLEISQLAGGLAHEIRNPLSTLSLNLGLLSEDFQNPETPRDRRIQQRVERLKREVQRLHDILENFLRFARVQELKLAPVDLNALVEELCDFYEPQASTQGIVVRTSFAPTCPGSLWTPTSSSRPCSTSCSTPNTPWRTVES